MDCTLDDYRNGQLYLVSPAAITEEELFTAYFDCLKHKRHSRAALEFELDLEHNLFGLLDEVNSFSYGPDRYSVFIIDKPVKREVFAASFRDRIVHHLIVNAINLFIEKRLIYDCYACRVGKGTHFGIERLRHFMASSTDNWKEEAWCLKLDIKGFFMSIDRTVLWKKLRDYLLAVYPHGNLPIIMYLLETVLFTDPTQGCRFCSPFSKWQDLDPSKSLFVAEKGFGLPIGNLTSQIMANFYLSFLDHYVKHDLGIEMYGRYVDDFFLIHRDKDYLKKCLHSIEHFLNDELHLRLNPKKVYLQPVNHGVKFLGVVVEPGHTNVARRTVSNFKKTIDSTNSTVNDHRQSKSEVQKSIASINSYLGLLSHYNTFSVRNREIDRLDIRFEKRVSREKGSMKLVFAC